MSDMSLDVPLPDSVDQKREAAPALDDASDSRTAQRAQLPLEADEADVADQARELDSDEDDYR